jgi:drug/metabolite transporter (DMT)-like permease
LPFLGEISAILTAICWSGSSIAFTVAAERTGSLQLNINRMILAAIFLFALILIFSFDYSLSSYQITNLVLSGLIGLVIGDTFLFKAYRHIGARLSMLLMALSPAMSALLAFFFLNEKISALGILGMFVTIAGVALVVLERSETPAAKYTVSKAGIFYGLMGALGQSVGLIFAKLAFEAGSINGFVATFVRVGSAVIIILPAALLIRRYNNPIKIYSKDSKALYTTLIGTVFGPVLGITLSLVAVANTKVGIAATLMSTMPIIMLPMVYFIYKDRLSWRAITGAFIAVGGVAMLFLH